MKTLKKIIFISIVLGMISSLIISCKSDDKQQTGLLTLSILEGKIKIGDYVSVELSLSHPDLISKIVVKKRDRKSTRLNSSHASKSRMPSSA